MVSLCWFAGWDLWLSVVSGLRVLSWFACPFMRLVIVCLVVWCYYGFGVCGACFCGWGALVGLGAGWCDLGCDLRWYFVLLLFVRLVHDCCAFDYVVLGC